jgi:hypothetical protein
MTLCRTSERQFKVTTTGSLFFQFCCSGPVAALQFRILVAGSSSEATAQEEFGNILWADAQRNEVLCWTLCSASMCFLLALLNPASGRRACAPPGQCSGWLLYCMLCQMPLPSFFFTKEVKRSSALETLMLATTPTYTYRHHAMPMLCLCYLPLACETCVFTTPNWTAASLSCVYGFRSLCP